MQASDPQIAPHVDGNDSDLELEAVLPPVSQHEVDLSEGALNLTGSSIPPTPFKAPPNPAVPQDISFIMEMVSANQVVGALPPLSMTAAEKRKLVEESMRSRKGKEKEAPHQAVIQASAKEGGGESDSDSSSEFESSEEEEVEVKKVNDRPLTEETHQQLRQELDHFVNPSPQAMETASDSESESESESEEEGILSGFAGKGFEFMEDSDGEADGGGGPITSTHEVSLIPVQQPPFERLPEGEKVSLAGDVVSFMREKKVEAWVEKERKRQEEVLIKQSAAEDNTSTETETTPVINETAVQPVEPAQKRRPSVSISPSKPNFVSSGTVVVRAMQSRPGAADEGWLEEGSVLCWEDGRVLGTVHETFGPLTSPFYTIRLPPPPFPYPSLTSLTAGTRLFYPLNPSYRSFVNMLAVRDPRFKGSDASNLYDEEIAEDEMEWSDDEAEAEAKKRRKARKSRTPSVMGTPRSRGGGSGGFAGLPPRPHSDFHPDDISDTASLYGAGADDWEGISDAGSTASSRARAMPAPYEVEVDETSGQAEYSGSRGGRGQGRGQGRERGRGRGGRGRGNGNSQQRGKGGRAQNFSTNNQSAEHNNHNQQSRQSPYLQQSWSPQQQQQQQQQQHQQQRNWSSHQPQQSQHFGAFPFAQPGFQMPMSMPMQMPFYPQAQPQGFSPQMNNSYNYPQSHQQQPYEQLQQGYDPTNPSASSEHVPQQQSNQQDGHIPAINPRFAAQYQQMMQGQGQSHGQGQAQWNENYGGYSE